MLDRIFNEYNQRINKHDINQEDIDNINSILQNKREFDINKVYPCMTHPFLLKMIEHNNKMLKFCEKQRLIKNIENEPLVLKIRASNLMLIHPSLAYQLNNDYLIIGMLTSKNKQVSLDYSNINNKKSVIYVDSLEEGWDSYLVSTYCLLKYRKGEDIYNNRILLPYELDSSNGIKFFKGNEIFFNKHKIAFSNQLKCHKNYDHFIPLNKLANNSFLYFNEFFMLLKHQYEMGLITKKEFIEFLQYYKNKKETLSEKLEWFEQKWPFD